MRWRKTHRCIWRKWFAWYPVRINYDGIHLHVDFEEWVWLEWIERRIADNARMRMK